MLQSNYKIFCSIKTQKEDQNEWTWKIIHGMLKNKKWHPVEQCLQIF